MKLEKQTFPATKPMPNVFQVTGTKNQSRLQLVQFKGIQKEAGHQDGWKVMALDHEYTLTVQPNCLMTAEGVDLFTGQDVAPQYKQLLKLPTGTVYMEKKQHFITPDAQIIDLEPQPQEPVVVTHVDLFGNCAGIPAFEISHIPNSKDYRVTQTFGDRAGTGFLVEGSPSTHRYSRVDLADALARHYSENMYGDPDPAWSKQTLASIARLNDPEVSQRFQQEIKRLGVPKSKIPAPDIS